MKIVPLAEILAQLSDDIKQFKEQLIVITENNRPVAAITVVVDPEEIERLALAHNPRFQQLLKDADLSIQETGGIKHDDFWQLLE